MLEALRKAGLFQCLLGLGALDMGAALRSPYQEAVSSAWDTIARLSPLQPQTGISHFGSAGEGDGPTRHRQ